jgi:hypothetical protein
MRPDTIFEVLNAHPKLRAQIENACGYYELEIDNLHAGTEEKCWSIEFHTTGQIKVQYCRYDLTMPELDAFLTELEGIIQTEIDISTERNRIEMDRLIGLLAK